MTQVSPIVIAVVRYVLQYNPPIFCGDLDFAFCQMPARPSRVSYLFIFIYLTKALAPVPSQSFDREWALDLRIRAVAQNGIALEHLSPPGDDDRHSLFGLLVWGSRSDMHLGECTADDPEHDPISYQ
jgi:hypothetical protein